MLNSHINNTPRENRSLSQVLNETGISRLGSPRITSTPVTSPNHRKTSPLVTPTKNLLVHKRYSLSNNVTDRSKERLTEPIGPLLASTQYSVNVGTYIDTKSLGYTGRIVQYNEQCSQSKPTRQQKYETPGLFPIVHLFKKDLPVISPKPRKVTVRIGSPDYSQKLLSNDQHRHLLLDNMIHSGAVSSSVLQSNDVGTRSVLDALKEISRKRLHGSEEYDLNEDTSKKIKKGYPNFDGESNKRSRVESPNFDNSISPSKPMPKKLCMIDPITASRTSSLFSTSDDDDKGIKRKSESSPITKVLPDLKKQMVNVETQTFKVKKLIPPVSHESAVSTEDTSTNTEEPIIVKPEQHKVLKVFDDKPLEIIRKNRLAALLSVLTGNHIPPIPLEDRKKTLDESSSKDLPESPNKLVSILSPQDKSPKHIEKHVRFSIPDSSTTLTTTVSASLASAASYGPLITQTSTSIATPIVSAYISGSPISTISEINLGFTATPKINNESHNEVNKTEMKLQTQYNVSPIIIKPKKSETAVSKPDIPFNSSSPLKDILSSTANSATCTGAGGFKFDLNTSSTNAPTTSSNSNTLPANTFIGLGQNTSDSKFGTSISQFSNPNASPTLKFNSSIVSSKDKNIVKDAAATFKFESSHTTENKSNSNNGHDQFGNMFAAPTNTSVHPVNSLGAPTLKFDDKPKGFSIQQTSISNAVSTSSIANPSKSLTPNFSPTTNSNTQFGNVSSVPINFGLNNATPTSGHTSTGAGFMLGTFATPSIGSSSFGSAVVTTISPSFALTSTTVSSTFGVPNFGTAISSTSMFGHSSSLSATTSSITTLQFAKLASPFASSNSPTVANGTVNSLNVASVSSTPTFVASSNIGGNIISSKTISSGFSFGSTAPSVPSFGTTSINPPFAAVTPQPKGFISKPFGTSGNLPAVGASTAAFGSTTIAPGFSGNSTSKTNSLPAVVPFGTHHSSTPTPSFGITNTTTSYGSNVFNSNNSDSFGTTPNVNPFSASPTVTSNTVFGGITSSSFGTNSGFGTFGNTSNPPFGASTTTPAFGSMSTPSFGSDTTAAFGVGTNTSTFGGSNVLGSTTLPVNGFEPSTNNTNAFGFNRTSAGTFGSQGQSSIPFGNSVPQNNILSFGDPPVQNSVFTFGSGGIAITSASSQAPTGVFSFGGNDAAKPMFNFGGGSNSSGFNSSTTNAFGNTVAGSAGFNGGPAFGAPAPAGPGMFSIGTGSSTPTHARGRTHLKAKRRT